MLGPSVLAALLCQSSSCSSLIPPSSSRGFCLWEVSQTGGRAAAQSQLAVKTPWNPKDRNREIIIVHFPHMLVEMQRKYIEHQSHPKTIKVVCFHLKSYMLLLMKVQWTWFEKLNLTQKRSLAGCVILMSVVYGMLIIKAPHWTDKIQNNTCWNSKSAENLKRKGTTVRCCAQTQL